MYRLTQAQQRWLSFSQRRSDLRKIWPMLTPFLSSLDQARLHAVDPEYHPVYGATIMFPPLPIFRSRLTGCGRDSAPIEARHHKPSGFILVHWCWDFLSVDERELLACRVSPIFRQYALLRQHAMTRSIGHLRHARPIPSGRPICRQRAYDMSITLIRCNFQYDVFIRTFGGLYTYQGRDWERRWDIIDSVADTDLPAGWPVGDTERAFRVMTLGIPLAGSYACSFDSVNARNLYSNHPTLATEEAIELVRKKFRKEEELSYNIVFPRWIWRFIWGLFISPLTYVMPKYLGDLGRICVDASNILSAFDDGAPNTITPRPGLPESIEENPIVFYGTGFVRLLQWIWNNRIDYPRRELMILIDDISAAFHRVYYHPLMMVIFSSVFEDFLAIPVGTVFGGRSSPSYYMDPGELRAKIASTFRFMHAHTALTVRSRLAPPPTIRETASFAQARGDALNIGAIAMRGSRIGSLHATFVDDTANADTRENILQAVTQSVVSAYVMFGFPGSDRWANRPPPINELKWIELISHLGRYLGFDIDTRTLLVTWPVEKRIRLAACIAEVFASHTTTGRVACRLISQVLGLLRNGCLVSPLGALLSLLVQWAVNDCVRAGAAAGRMSTTEATRRFWQSSHLRLSRQCINELRWLVQILAVDNPASPYWRRSIGLLIPRVHDFTFASDASYGGLGGWSLYHNMMWRLSKDDLVSLGFPMCILDEPSADDPADALHINVLEFLGGIINIWFAVVLCRARLIQPADLIHIGLFLLDNTSALSWIAKAGRTRNPIVRRLARFLQAFLTFAPLQLLLNRQHLAGVLNETADILSRPSRADSWASAMAQCPADLRTCVPYRVPHVLLLTLRDLVVANETVALSEERMTALATLAPQILPDGWRVTASQTSLYRPSHRSRASR